MLGGSCAAPPAGRAERRNCRPSIPARQARAGREAPCERAAAGIARRSVERLRRWRLRLLCERVSLPLFIAKPLECRFN